jgi:Flp pilus assembly protein CpaB
MSRRVIFLLALLIVAGGAIAALVISQQNNQQPANTPLPGETRVAQNPSGTPQATNTPIPTPLPTIDIVVAGQRINRGQVIQPGDVVIRTWPEPFAPLSAITDMELVVGSIARTDIEREMPILTSHLTDNLDDLSSVGSDVSAMLPPGSRMVAVPMDRLTSVAYALQPGDRVDLIVSMLYVDIDEDFQSSLPNNIRIISVEPSEEGGFTIDIEDPVDGRTDALPVALGALGVVNLPIIIQPSEDPRPRLATQMTIQDALVMYVGDFPRNGRIFTRASSVAAPMAETPEPTVAAPANQAAATPTPLPPRPDIISLAVSPQEAVVLAYFIEAKVPVTFALRPANETGIAAVQQVDIDYIMDQYRIILPRKLPYAIEPAIRSIRQLVASESISLLPTAAAVAPR